jgi:6-phosphogluconolactonase (cycloisomerase 2 family)
MMKRLVRLVSIAAATVAAGGVVSVGIPPALAAGPAGDGSRSAGAVFVQTDDVAGNAVVSYQRFGDGTLREVAATPTGGLGGALDGAVVDHLASQGSLALDRDRGLLYAVNAGSDSITVFDVDGARVRPLQVIASGGDFPVSIAVSGDSLYVLNARRGGSVQGYRRLAARLVLVPAEHRNLGLDPTQLPEFTHTPGQVAFTPDGRNLLVTTKANGNDIDVFAISRSGAIASTPVTTADPAAVPFAISFDRHGDVLIAEAGTNALAAFRLTAAGSLVLLDRAPTGQSATCWVVRSGRFFYASNAGSGSLTGVEVKQGALLTSIGNTPTDAGTVDATVSGDGRFLYVQAGAAGLVDGFRVMRDGSLAPTGTVMVNNAAGGEGIAAS